jgi:hypothetical protein
MACSDMRDKAKTQLFAVWLNVVSGKLNYDSPITFQYPAGQSVTMSPKQAIAAAEGAILNTAATETELEYAKDLAEILDNL